MKLTQGTLASALASAALFAAPAAKAADLPWVYTDDGSANRAPVVGTSAIWNDLFHWEIFSAFGQGRVNHFPYTILILR